MPTRSDSMLLWGRRTSSSDTTQSTDRSRLTPMLPPLGARPMMRPRPRLLLRPRPRPRLVLHMVLLS